MPLLELSLRLLGFDLGESTHDPTLPAALAHGLVDDEVVGIYLFLALGAECGLLIFLHFNTKLLIIDL